MNPFTCWIITEGHAGMQNQCVGLAEALGVPCVIKHVRPRAPWRYLPPGWWPRPLSMAATGTPLEAPWPDLVISCGRRSVAAAMAVRRAGGGKTFAVHIQDPHVPPERFDMLVVPEHDSLRGENVLVVRGALHRITREKLDRAAAEWAPRLAHLPRPLTGVLVGGSNRRQEVSPEIIADLADKLKQAAIASGGGLAVTPSRRTGARNEQILREALKDSPAWIWDGAGENPYFGLLGLADVLVATGDSISMVSEACATGRPVYVYQLEGGSRRFQAFHRSLEEAGMTRPFLGKTGQWSYNPVDETARAAEALRTRLRERGYTWL